MRRIRGEAKGMGFIAFGRVLDYFESPNLLLRRSS